MNFISYSKNSFCRLGVCLLLILLLSCSQKEKEQVDLETVKFGMLSYADHTYAIIGAKQGWFKEVGIDLRYENIKVEEIISSLKNDTLQVVSCPPGILFASYDNASNLVSFVFGDLFQGYAIMAQPNSGYKSYSEFIEQGITHEEAVKETIQQMKNKIFSYPTEVAIKPFIDLVILKGNLSRDMFKSLVLDDPLTVNAMRNKKADFQVGGVPSRLVLQREGFIPIIRSVDLAKGAEPSMQSKELSSILQNGWATTEEFYREQHNTILRLASVNYRIMKFINTNPKEAAALHMPYLTQLTGQLFTEKDAAIIYSDLDPFVSFEDQREWFNNEQSPFYYKYINGSILNSFKEQNIYKGTPPEVEDIIFADDVYNELEKLKKSCDQLFAKIEEQELVVTDGKLERIFQKAKHNYTIYNFLDAKMFAEEIIDISTK